MRIVRIVVVENVLRALRQRMSFAKGEAVEVVRGPERGRRKHVQLVQLGHGLNVATPKTLLGFNIKKLSLFALFRV